jgi:hypothetical protein
MTYDNAISEAIEALEYYKYDKEAGQALTKLRALQDAVPEGLGEAVSYYEQYKQVFNRPHDRRKLYKVKLTGCFAYSYGFTCLFICNAS